VPEITPWCLSAEALKFDALITGLEPSLNRSEDKPGVAIASIITQKLKKYLKTLANSQNHLKNNILQG
jgi:hypothetical protein